MIGLIVVDVINSMKLCLSSRCKLLEIAAVWMIVLFQWSSVFDWKQWSFERNEFSEPVHGAQVKQHLKSSPIIKQHLVHQERLVLTLRLSIRSAITLNSTTNPISFHDVFVLHLFRFDDQQRNENSISISNISVTDCPGPYEQSNGPNRGPNNLFYDKLTMSRCIRSIYRHCP